MKRTLIALAITLTTVPAMAQGYGRPGNYQVMPPVSGWNGFSHQTVYGPDGAYNITHFPGTHNYGYQPSYGYNRPFAEGYQMGQDLRGIFRALSGNR